MPDAMESREITVRGIRMRWEERGEGFPVILLHGIPTSPKLWRKVAPRLDGVRVLAWEMVGYGESIPEGRDRDISVARQAAYLRGWMRELGIERAVLAGHDLGGGVAQILATRHPEMCAGLFLTNAISYDSWPIPSVKALRAMGDLVEHAPDALFFNGVFKSFMRMGHADEDVAEESADIHWKPYDAHEGAADFVRQARSLDVDDTLAIKDALPRLGVPARVVWGVDDQFQKVSYGEHLAWDLDTPLQRIEGASHFTPEDNPDVIARALNELAQEAEARQGEGASVTASQRPIGSGR